MIIAKQKRTENIAEYILYMWQLEDLLRAYEFDVKKLVQNFGYPEQTLSEITQWYSELALAMKNEGLEKSGHLMQLKDIVQDLSMFNIKLLQKPDETEYFEIFTNALPHITEIVEKSNNVLKNEIDACFTGMYGILMLRLQKKQIGPDTEYAIATFSKLLSLLSFKFHQYEKGELEID
jgi:hypothetical protein